MVAVSLKKKSDWVNAHGVDAPLYIPDRMSEGYGTSLAAMRSLGERGAKVVVTVDCGAAALP